MERYRKEEKSIKQTISQLKKKQLILAEATKNYQHLELSLPASPVKVHGVYFQSAQATF
eukprot:COSAG03_NODE_21940_length_297_cov_0.909091_1_plen_58_part_01